MPVKSRNRRLRGSSAAEGRQDLSPGAPRYSRHLLGGPRPRPDPFPPPTWVQRLDLVVGQVEEAQVSQGLQVLHSADVVSSQGEEPAEHGKGGGVRCGGTSRLTGSEPAAGIRVSGATAGPPLAVPSEGGSPAVLWPWKAISCGAGAARTAGWENSSDSRSSQFGSEKKKPNPKQQFFLLQEKLDFGSPRPGALPAAGRGSESPAGSGALRWHRCSPGPSGGWRGTAAPCTWRKRGARRVLCAQSPLPASLGGEGGLCAGPHRLSGCGGSSSRGRFLVVMRLSVRVTPGGLCLSPGGKPTVMGPSPQGPAPQYPAGLT